MEIVRVFNFSDTSPFFEIVVDFSLYKIDDWNNDTFTVTINDQIVFQAQYSIDDPTHSICGNNSQGDSIVKIKARGSVESPIVNVSLQVNSSLVLWGFKDFKTAINRCSSSCLSCRGYLESECSECYPFSVKVEGVCSCYTGFYQKNLEKCDGFICSSCQICHKNCKSCFGPFENNCSECFSGFNLINNSCINDKSISNNNYTILFDLDETYLTNINLNKNKRLLYPRIATESITCSPNILTYGGYGIFDLNTIVLRQYNFTLQHYQLTFKIKLFLFSPATPTSSFIVDFGNNNVNEVLASDFELSTNIFCGKICDLI